MASRLHIPSLCVLRQLDNYGKMDLRMVQYVLHLSRLELTGTVKRKLLFQRRKDTQRVQVQRL